MSFVIRIVTFLAISSVLIRNTSFLHKELFMSENFLLFYCTLFMDLVIVCFWVIEIYLHKAAISLRYLLILILVCNALAFGLGVIISVNYASSFQRDYAFLVFIMILAHLRSLYPQKTSINLVTYLCFIFIVFYPFLLNEVTFLYLEVVFVLPLSYCFAQSNILVNDSQISYSIRSLCFVIYLFCVFFSLFCLTYNAMLGGACFLRKTFYINYDFLLILVAWVIFLISGFFKNKFNMNLILNLCLIAVFFYPFFTGLSLIYFESVLLLPMAYYIGKSHV